MRRQLRFVSVAMVGMLALTACKNPISSSSSGTSTPAGDAKSNPVAVMAAGWTKMGEVKSFGFDGSFSANVTSGTSKGTASLTMTGGLDSHDAQNPTGQLKLGGTLDMGAEGSIALTDLDVRAVSKKAYMSIGKLTATGGNTAGLDAVLAPYLSKWFYLDPTDSLFQALMKSAASSANVNVGTDATAAQDAAKNAAEILPLLTKRNLLTGVTFSTNESIGNVNTVKMNFTGVDTEALWLTLQDIAKIADPTQTFTTEDKTAYDKSMKEFGLSGAIWIGKDDSIPRKIEISVTDPAQANNSLRLVVSLNNVNQAFKVTEPTGAENFMTTIQSMSSLLSAETPATPSTSTYNDAEYQQLLNQLQANNTTN